MLSAAKGKKQEKSAANGKNRKIRLSTIPFDTAGRFAIRRPL
jgi:hypothetical protein